MEDRSFYVYAHYRLDTMEPFYIGKGKGIRKDALCRNPIHDSISKKHGHAVVILYDNLTEKEAFFYEREVIEDLVFNEGYEIPCKNCGEFTKKFSYLTNFSFGGEGTCGYIHDEESKKKISEGQKKRYKNPKEIEKMSKAQKKRYRNPKEIEKMRKIQRKRYKNPEERKKAGISSKKIWKNAETREKIIKGIKTSWKNTEIREKQSKAIKTSWKDTKIREKRSKAMKISWEDTERRKAQSEIMKNYWENEKRKKTQSKAIKNHLKNKKRKKISDKKNCNAKSVYCNELNIIFSYIGLAKKYCVNILNSKIGQIYYACDGKVKSTGEYNGTKLTWYWTKNVDKKILDEAEYIDNKKYEEIINERKKCNIPCELNYYETSVYCNELNILFSYIALAEKYCVNVLNSKIGKIRYACDGKRKSAGKLADGTKLTWSWTKNLDKETLNNAEYIDSKKYEEIINAKINN